MKRKIKRYTIHMIEIYYNGTEADKRLALKEKPKGFRWASTISDIDTSTPTKYYLLFTRTTKDGGK